MEVIAKYNAAVESTSKLYTILNGKQLTGVIKARIPLFSGQTVIIIQK